MYMCTRARMLSMCACMHAYAYVCACTWVMIFLYTHSYLHSIIMPFVLLAALIFARTIITPAPLLLSPKHVSVSYGYKTKTCLGDNSNGVGVNIK